MAHQNIYQQPIQMDQFKVHEYDSSISQQTPQQQGYGINQQVQSQNLQQNLPSHIQQFHQITPHQQQIGQLVSQQQQPNQQRQGQQMAPTNGLKYKTSICRHFRNGNCQLGDTCHFAHGDEEMRASSDPVPQVIPQQHKVISNFKTVKCRYFEKGFCKNQNACCFAHGDTDLSMQNSNPYQSPPQMMPPSKMTDSILFISILQNLEQVFPNDKSILSNLKYAQQLARQGDQRGAFNIISEIMKDPKRTDEEKVLYNTIQTNAQMFYQQQLYNQSMMANYSPFMNFQQPALDPVSLFLQQQQQQQQVQQIHQQQLQQSQQTQQQQMQQMQQQSQQQQISQQQQQLSQQQQQISQQQQQISQQQFKNGLNNNN